MLNYSKYNGNNVGANAPQKKTVPDTTTQYNTIRLNYNKGDKDAPKIDDFVMEAPKLRCIGGIRTEEKKGKFEYSVMVALRQSDPAQKAFTDCLLDAYKRCCLIVEATKSAHGMFDFNLGNPGPTGFTCPVYYARDKATGKTIEGRDPVMFIKLFSRKMAGIEVRSLFTGIDGKALPWNLLKAVEMEFIPAIHLESIYIGGGKIRQQIKLKSAIVTEVKGLNTESEQRDTLASLSSDKDLLKTLAEQISKLTMSRGGTENTGTGAGKEGTSTPVSTARSSNPESKDTGTGGMGQSGPNGQSGMSNMPPGFTSGQGAGNLFNPNVMMAGQPMMFNGGPMAPPGGVMSPNPGQYLSAGGSTTIDMAAFMRQGLATAQPASQPARTTIG